MLTVYLTHQSSISIRRAGPGQLAKAAKPKVNDALGQEYHGKDYPPTNWAQKASYK